MRTAGTEVGITEPTTTFSACFGAAFTYTPREICDAFRRKIKRIRYNCLVGKYRMVWGSYGVGSRMKLSYTRSMITAAEGNESKGDSILLLFLNWHILPLVRVPAELLNPKQTWADSGAYDETAAKLASKFVDNFEAYKEEADPSIIAAAPKILVK